MVFSSKLKTLHPIRSLSLPSRSHPSTDKIDVELNKLKLFDISSSSCSPNAIEIINGLLQLDGLFKCLGDFLNLGVTKQALSHHQQCERHLDDIQDKFMSLLEISGPTKDFVSQMKEFCRDIQSSLRRQKTGDQSDIVGVVAQSNLYRNIMMKDVTKLATAFKQINNGIINVPVLGLNDHVHSIIRVLREVIATTTSIFQSVLVLFRALFFKPKTRRSMVSKLLHREELNELQVLDMTLGQLSKIDSKELGDNSRMKVEQDRVNFLVDEIENGVESLYRGLIKTRAYLLNIGSSML